MDIKNRTGEIEDMQEEKPYKIGYVPGVFDLFHIGHLNLIKRAKEKSEYLIAGVLNDELVKHFKGKYPVIPFEQRKEIVGAIKEVDEVVEVDFNNTVKMDAWRMYHYDAYFSGSDHGSEWDREKKLLNEVGSDIVFFSYTMSTSSTKIKKELAVEGTDRVYIFGAGKMGLEMLKKLKEEKNKWKIEGFLDNSIDKHLTRVDGVPVYAPKDILTLEKGAVSQYSIIISMKAFESAKEQLIELGLERRIKEEQK